MRGSVQTASRPQPQPRFVYIIEDGSRVDAGMRYFRFGVWEGGSVVRLLRVSEEKLHVSKPLTHIYTYTGQSLTTLQSLSETCKVLLVSASPHFTGLKWTTSVPLSESVLFSRISARDEFRLHPLAGLNSSPRVSRLKTAQSLSISSPKVRENNPTPRMKSPISRVDEMLRPLSNEQLAVLCERYGFTIAKVHELYARYKTLLAVQICDHPKEEGEVGIDQNTFVHYLRGSLIYGHAFLTHLYTAVSGSHLMTWSHFLRAMSYLSVGTRKEKISLVLKLSSGGSSLLNYEKVRDLCLVALGHAKRDSVVDEIADYFAKTVFKKAGIGRFETVTAEKLQDVMEKDPNDDFLQLFSFSDDS